MQPHDGKYTPEEAAAIIRFLDDNISVAESCMEDIDGLKKPGNQLMLAPQRVHWEWTAKICCRLKGFIKQLIRK